MFRDSWVTLNSVPTRIVTWGCWIEDEITSDTVVVVIPGNPGIIDFYLLFLETLFKILGCPVWIVNHAGNEPVPKGLRQPDMASHPELYNVAGQIQQKKTFIETYVPEEKKIILIGHSVGSKICVELLKDEKISRRVVQAHLVTPTLQHIAQTYNGRWLVNVFKPIIPAIVALAWIFCLIPFGIRRRVLSLYVWMRSDWKRCDQESCTLGILKLFTPQVSRASLLFASDEMEKIKELDSEVYDSYYEKIYCYFAPDDSWAPIHQYHSLMEKHPKINGSILDAKFTHAFVLTSPTDMAEELAKNIIPAIKKYLS